MVKIRLMMFVVMIDFSVLLILNFVEVKIFCVQLKMMLILYYCWNMVSIMLMIIIGFIWGVNSVLQEILLLFFFRVCVILCRILLVQLVELMCFSVVWVCFGLLVFMSQCGDLGIKNIRIRNVSVGISFVLNIQCQFICLFQLFIIICCVVFGFIGLVIIRLIN